MPELPEVETVRRGLESTLVGARILRVELRRADFRFPFPENFAENLQGRRIESLNRRAKYLVAPLDDGSALISHLGMSGSFRVEARENDVEALGAFAMPRSKNPVHDHVILHFDNKRVIYNDPRRFGFMTITREAELESLIPFFAS